MNLIAPHPLPTGKPDARLHYGNWGRGIAAFTMIEIALCLAVVGIALVSILGVMPTGLEVQKDNREDTIINLDGELLLEALKSGGTGFDFLTNHVRYIRHDYVGTSSSQVFDQFNSGREILGLMSYPAYEMVNNLVAPLRITARLNSISGSAVLKGTGESDKDFDLNYMVSVELFPAQLYSLQQTNFLASNLQSDEIELRRIQWLKALNVATNFHEVRLKISWPVYETGTGQGAKVNVGKNTKTFRTLLSGHRIAQFYGNEELNFIRSENFTQIKP